MTIKNKKTILFALTSHGELGDTGRRTGAYAPEFAHPSEVFEREGYDIAFVSVSGGEVPLDGVKEQDTTTTEFLDRPDIARLLTATPKAEELDAADYAAIYFAGGHGTMWDFPNAAGLARLAAAVYDGGGVVGAVCHGPAGLLNVTLGSGCLLVDGKAVSSFSNEEERAVGLSETVPFLLEDALIDRGANHTKAGEFAKHAVADGRLVTGQNPASAVKVAELMVEALR